MPLPLIVAVIALVAAAAWRVASARASAQSEADTIERIKGGQEGECRALRDRLATMRVQGGNVEEQRKVEAALRRCETELERLGLDSDRFGAAVESIATIRTQIDQEWSHYRSTSDSDFVKRSNTRGTIRRLVVDVVRRLREALALARTGGEVDAVEHLALGVAREAFDRARCFELSQGGCGRSGVSEPDWDERAQDEYLSGVVPIVGAVEVLINGKLSALPRWDLIGHGTATEPLGTRLFNEKKDKLRGATLNAARDHLLAAIGKRRGELSAALLRSATERNMAARLGPLAFGIGGAK